MLVKINAGHNVNGNPRRAWVQFGEYGEINKAWTADDVKGFTKILGTSLKIYNSVNKNF